jgi:hypothetical protein
LSKRIKDENFLWLLKEVIGSFTSELSPNIMGCYAGDLGSVVDLMDQGHLKQIKTNGQSFTNSPNEKFMLMILCSQAKLEK